MTTIKPATPLPWVTYNGQVFAPTAKDRGPVVECRIRVGTHVPHDANLENLNFVLHACNAYPELVAALRDTVEELTHHELDGLGNQRRADARALLAKLGEG